MGLIKEFYIQLYSVRHLTNDDFDGTLRKIAETGYDGVEFAGYGGKTAKEMKSLLSSLGLRPFGTHAPLEKIEDGSEIEYNAELGTEYIICPMLRSDTEDGWRAYAERLKKAGMTFGYHNHAHEFALQPCGHRPAEIIFGATDPALVKAELDVYWAACADMNPLEVMESLKDRLALLHVKQMNNAAEKKCVDLDLGCIDYKVIAEKAAEYGVKGFVLEQEEFSGRGVWDALKVNYEYMTNL